RLLPLHGGSDVLRNGCCSRSPEQRIRGQGDRRAAACRQSGPSISIVARGTSARTRVTAFRGALLPTLPDSASSRRRRYEIDLRLAAVLLKLNLPKLWNPPADFSGS